MIWVVVWVVLVVGAAVPLALLGRRVWRSGKALAADFAEASARIDRVMTPLQEAVEDLEDRQDRREELAVFDNPGLLRRERAKAAKGRGGTRAGRRSNGRHRVDPGPSRFGATSQGATRPSRERTT